MNAEKATGNLAAQGDTLVVSCVGKGTVGIQIEGTFSATITFEASLDNTNWVAINCTPIGSTTPATTTTSAGIWQCCCAGMNLFRARASAFSSGPVVVNLETTSAAVTKY